MAKRLISMCLIAGLLVTSQVAWAGKKPKPYKSEEVTIAVPHPVGYSATGSPQAVVTKELEARCAAPSTNGLDGYAFEVPKEYQSQIANVEAIGTGSLYDLDIYLYDTKCQHTIAINATGTDEAGLIPKGTGWIFVHNYVGEPAVKAHIELSI